MNKKTLSRVIQLKSIFIFGVFFLISCEKEAFHTRYLEKQMSLMISPEQGVLEPLKWSVPEGWVQSLGDKLRQAAFMVVHEGEIAECTIVQLAGPGGDVDANIKRWMGQLKIIPLTPDEMDAFVLKQDSLNTADGSKGIYVDLTTLMSGDMTSKKSIIGAIVPLEKSTVFVKLMGNKSILKANQSKLKELVKSLRVLRNEGEKS